jgi:pantoate--beta-alanine ligase
MAGLEIARTVEAVRAQRRALGPLALVATMGNLHEGHLALVRQARDTGLPVAASIFVNRLQFGPKDDFERYPRTFEDDLSMLEREGVRLVFAPDETELYPEPQTWKIAPPPALGDILEGAFRPGFFTGVATVVLKLFNLVRPEATVFGKKDYQQCLVVAAMCRQLALPIRLLLGETLREPDGLAMSSRNRYLDAAERAEAPALHQALGALLDRAPAGDKPLETLEAEAMAALAGRGWTVDYLTVRRQDDLGLVDRDMIGRMPVVALGAARLGGTRLIDNIELDPH